MLVRIDTTKIMSPDAALAVVPFFAPLVIIFCGLSFGLARSQTQMMRRVDLLEQKVNLLRAGAKAPRSPLAAVQTGSSKESV
jgi:hypothetical protein